MSHGRIPHHNAFFLGEPLGHKIAAGDIACRHNAAHNDTHTNGIHGVDEDRCKFQVPRLFEKSSGRQDHTAQCPHSWSGCAR